MLTWIFFGGGGHYFSSTAECTAKPDHIYARKKSKLAGFFFLLGWKQRKAVISDLSLTAR